MSEELSVLRMSFDAAYPVMWISSSDLQHIKSLHTRVWKISYYLHGWKLEAILLKKFVPDIQRIRGKYPVTFFVLFWTLISHFNCFWKKYIFFSANTFFEQVSSLIIYFILQSCKLHFKASFKIRVRATKWHMGEGGRGSKIDQKVFRIIWMAAKDMNNWSFRKLLDTLQCTN